MSDTSTSPSRVGTPVSVAGDEIHTARPYRFTWDPSTRKPGPESVSGTTEGRGDYFHTQLPPLGFLNTSTTTLAVGALPEEWSSTRHGFHGSCLPPQHGSNFDHNETYSHFHRP